MTATVLTERAPGPGWSCHGYVSAATGTHYQRGPIRVISSLVEADLPDGSGVGLQWHVSISKNGKRPTARQVARALHDFGMVGAELDNHHAGNAQHFWRPVDPKHRVDCECKAEEQVIVEPDGYTWTNPRPETGEVCRGCDLRRLLGTRVQPCPIHGVGTGSDFSPSNEEAKQEPRAVG